MKAFAAILILLVVLTACAKKDETGDWTILVYMAADNGLSGPAGLSIADTEIDQIESAVMHSGTRVIVQVDRAADAQYPGALRYEIRHDMNQGIASEVVGNLGEIDSSDPASLTAFIRWGVRHYPADRVALVIWSHGDGWYRGSRSTCPDYTIPGGDGREMRISDGSFRHALADAGVHLDLLLMDACLMQTMEVIGEARGVAGYMIGSEDEVPVAGFPYADILPLFTAATATEEILAPIPQLYVDSHLPGGSQYESGNPVVSCSVADLARYDDFLGTCAAFVEQWGNRADSLRPAVEACEPLGVGNDALDVREFFDRASVTGCDPMLNDACRGVLDAVDALFPARASANHGDHALGCASLWFPHSGEILDRMLEIYRNFIFYDSRWTDFLASYYR